MTLLSEKRDVQHDLINHLIGIGWEYLPPADVAAARGEDEKEPFLPEIARRQLIELNGAGAGLVTADNVGEVLRRLRGIAPSVAGNERFLNALRGRWTQYHAAEKRECNLTLIDFDEPGRNHFCFTQELTFADYDRRRMDMVLFVNGLPVVVIENKSPTVREPELEAFDQVQGTYTARIPGFIKFTQLFAACNTRLHYGPTWNDDLKAFYRWKVDGKDYGLERLSQKLFDQAHLLRMLRDYVIFFRDDDQTQKYILRPHQIRAVERIVRRVEAGQAKTGLIWHTQGSGKTLSMIVAAQKLRRLPELQNPTLLIVVDRLELETQMVQNLEAFGFAMAQRATSKNHLRDLLAADYRGLVVTTVHKFDRIPKNLNTRENIVVLIDEAHRTQEGDLGTYMRAALPNAVYIGCTGTPIDRGKIGQGTFATFGGPDPRGYLDKYGIEESVEDGTTVPLYYTLAPSQLRLDRETLEKEFYEIIEDVASIEELNRLLDKADKLKAVLKAPDRVDSIATHVAKHYLENVEPLGFKAFLVGVDREACALYKEALDQHLPADYSQVVYTPYHKDRDLLRRYYLDQNAEKQVRKAFRDAEKLPRILIVTQKLLTGYDAPVLYAMYLDKPLKNHTLLQAIARVNRPYPDKANGLIVDYIGIFEDLQRALAFDQADISRALIDLAELQTDFVRLLADLEAAVEPIDLSGDKKDRSARIIEHFAEPEVRAAYFERFKALQTAYETLSPDPFLRDYLRRYAMIAQIYQVVYNYFHPDAQKRKLQRELLKKTDKLIRESVEVEYLTEPLALYPINRSLATVVAADNVSDQVKVINLWRSLITHIEEVSEQHPYLVSIGNEVEAIIQRLRERQISVELALEQVQEKIGQAMAAEEEQLDRAMPGKAFAFLWVLRGFGVPDPEQEARGIEETLDSYPGWPYSEKIERTLRIKLYTALKDQVAAEQLKEAVDNLLKMHRTVM
jgi:type I restriction enzyme R subunit